MASSPASPPPEEAVIPSDPVLGGPLAHHPSNRIIPLFTAGVIGAPIAALLALTAAQTDAWWSMPVTVGGVAAAAWALGWYVLHYWNREVVLFQRGFSFREGSRVVYFSYDEVRWIGVRARRLAYFGGLYKRDRYLIEVVTYAGDTIRITSLYQRAAALAARLTDLADKSLRREVDRLWARGEPVGFSPALTLDANGIVHTDESGARHDLLWPDYGGYAIGGGALTIRRRDGTQFAALPLDSLYNHTLLIDLLRRHKPA